MLQTFSPIYVCKGKGKAGPLQAWIGPEGSRKLRFPDFTTTAQDGGKVGSLTHRPPLTPGNNVRMYFYENWYRYLVPVVMPDNVLHNALRLRTAIISALAVFIYDAETTLAIINRRRSFGDVTDFIHDVLSHSIPFNDRHMKPVISFPADSKYVQKYGI